MPRIAAIHNKTFKHTAFATFLVEIFVFRLTIRFEYRNHIEQESTHSTAKNNQRNDKIEHLFTKFTQEYLRWDVEPTRILREIIVGHISFDGFFVPDQHIFDTQLTSRNGILWLRNSNHIYIAHD